MNHDLLEEILSCPRLPSLPAVALQVINLTSDENVSLKDLAATIQNDQALAAKVLRTVNSSFYGLRERCATIQKAIVMLGLGPVKTLALGFSLVATVEANKSPRFDYVGYWRRGLVSAVGARVVAEAAKLDCGDEAFLAAMLQDVGMLAMHQVLEDDYLTVTEATRGDHRKLVKLELDRYEIQHPDIGAMLAKRWRLPDKLVIPIKYHERPTAAPNEAIAITHCAAIGGLAHDAISDTDPGPAMRRYFERCENWLRLPSDTASDALKRISEGAKEMSKLFSVDIGAQKRPEEILREAESRLIAINTEAPRPSYAAQQFDELVSNTVDADPITGAMSKERFFIAGSAAFDQIRDTDDAAVMIQVAVDGVAEAARLHGPLVADQVVIGVVSLLNSAYEPLGGIIARLGGTLFAVLLPCGDPLEATTLADHVRTSVAANAPHWLANAIVSDKPPQLDAKIALSIGVATGDKASRDTISTFERLAVAAAKALQTARAQGGNRIETYAPRAAA